MQNASHPDDERLAAYAGGDAEAIADSALTAHISSCDRCGPMVGELAGLRIALAELPDVAPSRPLRLIPPAAAPRATAGVGSWLRRLTAPAMAAGAGLVLVGAIGIGATGAFGGFGQAASAMFQNVGENLQGAGAPESEATASDSPRVPGVSSGGTPMATSSDSKGATDSSSSVPPGSLAFGPQSSPTAIPEDTGGIDHAAGGSSDEQPWLTLLIAGAGIFVIATALRFTISPRAG